MAGSLKDALEKSGLATPDEAAKPAAPSKKEWLNELPPEESRQPYMPFEAPARTKVKETKTPRTGK